VSLRGSPLAHAFARLLRSAGRRPERRNGCWDLRTLITVGSLLISTAIFSGCGSGGPREPSRSAAVHAAGRPYLRILTFKILHTAVTPAIIAKTAFVMRARLRAAHIDGTISSTRRGYLRATLDTTLPKKYTSRLLTQMGDVTFRTMQKGDLYRSRSSRPIRSATLESPQYAATHSGIISNTPVVIFVLSDPNSFARFTGAHVGQDLGIYLDDRLISAPRLMGPISNSGAIFGGIGGANFLKDLAFIAAVMNSGPLPAHVTFVSASPVISG